MPTARTPVRAVFPGNASPLPTVPCPGTLSACPRTDHRTEPQWRRRSVRGRLLRADTGVGAHRELGELVLRGWLAPGERAEHRAEEAERDADDARILEREDCAGLHDAGAH